MESSLGMPEYKADTAWFLSPSPKTSRNFAWTPMWRWADTTQYLDEVTLACDSQGNKVVSFNGNGWHGRWFLDNTSPGLGAKLRVDPWVHDLDWDQRHGPELERHPLGPAHQVPEGDDSLKHQVPDPAAVPDSVRSLIRVTAPRPWRVTDLQHRAPERAPPFPRVENCRWL